MGVETAKIPDSFMTSSTVLDADAVASHGRLNYPDSAWSPAFEDEHPYLQIFLGKETQISGIATQGHPWEEWFVMKYTLQYSDDGITWSDHVDGFGDLVVSKP